MSARHDVLTETQSRDPDGAMPGAIIEQARRTENVIHSILSDHYARLSRRINGLATREGRRSLRNSVRELSYAVEFFSPLIAPGCLSEINGSLETIYQAVGEVCDEETFVKALIKVQPTAPPELINGIRRLVDERTVVLTNLVDGLSTQCEPQFQKLYEVFSGNADEHPYLLVPPSLAFERVARNAFSTCLDDFVAASTALYRPSKTRTTHRLRISLRKLRHALEVFAPYLGPDLFPLSAELTPLHARLGKLRDCDLKLHALGNWLTAHHATVTSGNEMTCEWNAAVWLIAHLFDGRPKRYRKALQAGQDLAATGFVTRARNAIAGAPVDDIIFAVDETTPETSEIRT